MRGWIDPETLEQATVHSYIKNRDVAMLMSLQVSDDAHQVEVMFRAGSDIAVARMSYWEWENLTEEIAIAKDTFERMKV